MKLSYAAALPVIIAMTVTSGVQAGADAGKFGTCDPETEPKSRACFHELYVSECAGPIEVVATEKENHKNARKALRGASEEEAEALQADFDQASEDLKTARELNVACRRNVRADFGRRAERRDERRSERREERQSERQEERRSERQEARRSDRQEERRSDEY